MATYFIVSTLCSAVLFFSNIKKRFTVKITYVLTFLITYILLNYAIHSETESNVYFGIMMAFPSLFVSLMFTRLCYCKQSSWRWTYALNVYKYFA